MPTSLKSVTFDAPALARVGRCTEEGGFGSDPVRRYFSLSCLVEVGVGRSGEGIVGEVANALVSLGYGVFDFLRDFMSQSCAIYERRGGGWHVVEIGECMSS